MIVSNGSHLVL